MLNSAQLDSRTAQTYSTTSRSAARKGSNTQHDKRTNTTSAFRSPTKHHPGIARHTHPPTKPSTHQPTHHAAAVQQQTDALFRTRTSPEQAGYTAERTNTAVVPNTITEFHLPQARKHSPKHETTATHPPNQPPASAPTHPTIKNSNQYVLQQYSSTAQQYSSTYELVRTPANRGDWSVLGFSSENTIVGTLHHHRSTITCYPPTHPPILTHPPTHNTPMNRYRYIPTAACLRYTRTCDYNAQDQSKPPSVKCYYDVEASFS